MILRPFGSFERHWQPLIYSPARVRPALPLEAGLGTRRTFVVLLWVFCERQYSQIEKDQYMLYMLFLSLSLSLSLYLSTFDN